MTLTVMIMGVYIYITHDVVMMRMHYTNVTCSQQWNCRSYISHGLTF